MYFGGVWDELCNNRNVFKWICGVIDIHVRACMLSIREQRFLTRLQKKYRKKIFELISDGETQSLLVDGEELNFAWSPPLSLLSDSCSGSTEVLFNDCVAAIKETTAAEKRRKREAKKAYLKQNK
jgi:hypothetical protein